LDPRAARVVVPPWFKKQPQLVLQIGLNMPVPIPDLRLDDEGMSCTLSFNRAPFYCVVPWPSVYAMVGDDGRGMVWPDDVPPEVVHQAKVREGDGAAAKKAPAKRAGLSAVAPASPPRVAVSPSSAPLVAADSEAAAKPPSAKDDAKKKAKRRTRPEERPLGAPQGDGRGMLSPVPAKRQVPAAAPQPAAAKSPAQQAPATPRAPNGQKKRELPPYLRVVK
jgi:hypothetical protein